MATLIPLRKKYKIGGWGKRTVYRGRTGPNCCHKNCASGYKKGRGNRR